jgi:monovalent cation:H+ antiporter, CPA1 family
MEIEAAFILLFVVATAVAIAVRRLRIPYTVALVLTGILLGELQLLPAPHLTKNLLFSVFLPGLIFEAAFHIDSREFRSNLITILVLAIPGVIVSTALVTVALTPVVHALGIAPAFDWRVALVFGALIAATDPVAVVALFRNMGAPRRLTLLLDGESLLNDGTAIVFFTLSLSLLGGGTTEPGPLVVQFFSIVGGGLLIGAAIGGAASALTRNIDDPMIEITLTTIAAYGSFVSAETLHTSGVIATVAAGMLCGNFGVRGGGMSASTRVAAKSFWEYVGFALNSIVFLLIGFEIHLSTLLTYWPAVVVAYLVVTLGRGLMIGVGQAVIGLTRERFPARWGIVLTWGGLRGALPMVLVLSLPKEFPYRDLIISMTFGVAVISILVHGLTMSGLLRWLDIVTDAPDQTDYEVKIGKLQAAAAALHELDRLAQMRSAAPETLDDLRVEYGRIAADAEREVRDATVSAQTLRNLERRRIQRHLLDVERDRVGQSFAHGTLGRHSHDKLLADIDCRLLTLKHEPPLASAEMADLPERVSSPKDGPLSEHSSTLAKSDTRDPV